MILPLRYSPQNSGQDGAIFWLLREKNLGMKNQYLLFTIFNKIQMNGHNSAVVRPIKNL